MKVLVTGANGFIGSSLMRRILGHKCLVAVAGVRTPACYQSDLKVITAPSVDVREYRAAKGSESGVSGIDVVVHLAARAHILGDSSSDQLTEFRLVNVDGTLSLARAALEAGVRRFIFVSSIGVNGAETFDSPLSETDAPAPHADYALSKWEAEEGLRELVAGTDMELVIIRPPLVYGANAPGNFGRLLRLVESGLPLPLGSIDNRRSFVALPNLVDFIMTCIDHPKAAGELFVISDGEDVSTPQMIRLLVEGMGRKANLWPCPPSLLKLGARMLGKEGMYQQLCGSLQVDSSKAWELLGWTPVVSVDEGLRQAGREYIANKLTGSDAGKAGKVRGADKELRREEKIRREGSAPTGTRDGESRESGRG